MALLSADVNYKIVRQFEKNVKARAVDTEILSKLTPAQSVIKIVDEELAALMGGKAAKINISSKPPTVILMVGLQGSGKTTSAGKLALIFTAPPLLNSCRLSTNKLKFLFLPKIFKTPCKLQKIH